MNPHTKSTLYAETLQELLKELGKYTDSEVVSNMIGRPVVVEAGMVHIIYRGLRGQPGYHQVIHIPPAVLLALARNGK